MNYKRIVLFLVPFLLFPLSDLAKRVTTSRPHGLMTDLIAHTELIWQNGQVTKIPIWKANLLKSPFQYAAIRSSHPRFTWIVDDGMEDSTYQQAYRIIVSDKLADMRSNRGTLWNSGWVNSNQSVAVAYQGKRLRPNTTYFWKVKEVTNTGGESNWSAVKAFRTGPVLSDESVSFYPLEKVKEYPDSLTAPAPDVLLADFGKDAFSQISLKIYSSGKSDTVRVRLGECLANGRINRNPGGTIRYSEYDLPLKKGSHVYSIQIIKNHRNTSGNAILMPKYIGEVVPFRYCEIEGKGIRLKKEDIVRQFVHYPFNDEASSFNCNNAILNKVYDLCKYSVKATSFAGVYVDGDRERIPYAADAYINQLSHYGVDREYSMARRTYYYILNHPTWPTEWILQTALLAWNDYLFTGDNRMLLSTWQQLEPYILTDLQEKNGLISTRTGLQTPAFLASIKSKGKISDIVDWPSYGQGLNENMGGETDGFIFTDYNTVVNAYYYEALKVMSLIARAVGRQNEYTAYSHHAEDMKTLFNDYFWNKTVGGYQDGLTTAHASLHSNFFALAFDLVPHGRYQSVFQFIKSRGMACSVYGAQFLLEALYKAGDDSYALNLLTKTDDRSWYNMMRAGSTITMEAWDNKYKPNQDWNHAWGSAPANIIPMKLLGIEPLEPGYEVLGVRPRIGNLKWVDATVPTIRGAVHMHIDNDGKSYQVQLTIPANMKAKLDLPFSPQNYNITDNGKVIRFIQSGDSPSSVTMLDPGFHRLIVSYTGKSN
jgi:hypothetical protein